MPVYTFGCNECDVQFDDLVGLSDPLPMCPVCGKVTIKMVTLPRFAIPAWMGDDAINARSRQREHWAKPENKKKLMSGEYEVDRSSHT